MRTSVKTFIIIIISIVITSGFVSAQRSGTTTSRRTTTPADNESYVSGSDESYDEYRDRTNTTSLERRRGESEENQRRLGQILENIRQANETTPATTSSRQAIPERPAKRPGESDTSYNNRLRQWDAMVRENATPNVPNTMRTTGVSDLPERPVQRAGESADAYMNRLRTWEAQVRQLSNQQTEKQKDEELSKVEQELQKMIEQVSRTRSSLGISNSIGTNSQNMLIIPSGEMSIEGLMKINEDLNIMSRILVSELHQEIAKPSKVEWVFSNGSWVPVNISSYSTIRQGVNTISSMYLQDYGALFNMQVNFSLSVPTGIQSEQEETQKEDTDDMWQQTRRQLYEAQPPTRGNSINRVPVGLIFGEKKIEELKTTLIQALKHASNIRSLRPDESVILRIAGADEDESIKVLRVVKDGDKSIIEFEKNGIRQATKFSGDIKDYLKSISTPTVLIIRAKKSYIDEFAEDELDFDKFREKVQVFSYPLISGNIN